MTYDNTNTGVLFTNKKTTENQPDHKGKINVNGVEFELAGWVKQGKNGPILSLKLSEPYKKEDQQNVSENTKTGISFF